MGDVVIITGPTGKRAAESVLWKIQRFTLLRGLFVKRGY